MSVNVIQLNCQHSYDVMCELGTIMVKKNIDVALLQEPYVSNGSVKGLPLGMRIFAAEGIAQAAIVVNNNKMTAMMVDQLTDLHAVCVQLRCDIGTIYMVSLYCQFSLDISPFLNYLVRAKCDTAGNPLLVGMDANAVSPMWFSKGVARGRDADERGRLLEDVILSSHFEVLNEPTSCYSFSTINGQSDIDVTLANNEFTCNYTGDWTMSEVDSISDHNAISIVVACRGNNAMNVNDDNLSMCWSVKGQVDWNSYKNTINGLACSMGTDIFENLSLEEKADTLLSWIYAANESHLRRIKTFRNKIAWWNDDLKLLRSRTRKLRKIFQRKKRTGPGLPEWASYMTCRREYARQIREAKNNHWQSFVREEGNSNPWGKVYKLCKSGPSDRGVCSLKVDGVFTKDWKESVDALLNEFFPGDSRPHHNSSAMPRVVEAVTADEMEMAVRTLRRGRAPGIDGVKAEMLKCVWNAIPVFLTCLFSECISKGLIPFKWKLSRVIILRKGGNKPKNEVRSYRPICLISSFSKVLEKILVSRLSSRLPTPSPQQYGFKLNKSTIDAWADAVSAVNGSSRKYVYGVFVDFKGAFDNLSWSVILEFLDAMACPELSTWVSYFNSRSVCFVENNDRVDKIVSRGCPQGSICGPFIWNMIMDSLLIDLQTVGCHAVGYADDLLILVEGNSRRELELLGSRYMRMVFDWGRYAGVEVSTTKTVGLTLKGHISSSRPPSIKVDRYSLKNCTHTKYLGIVVGERLTFKPHLLQLNDKIKGAIGGLRRVLRKVWGLNKHTVNILYNGMLTPCAMYGAEIWGSSMNKQYARILIERSQRTALYACLNVCRTVSTEAMQVLLGLPPWDLVALGLRRKHELHIGHVSDGLLQIGDLQGLSRSKTSRGLNQRIVELWQARWDYSEKGRVTHGFIRDVRFSGLRKWFYPSLRLGFVLTGHGTLNEFLHRRALAESPACSCGAPLECWKHVLQECPLYADLRLELNVENFGMEYTRYVETEDAYSKIITFCEALFKRKKELR